jgi:hypothetical protein
LKGNVDLTALLIFLSFFLVAGVAWFWFIAKRTGRPFRDLLTLFAAAITLVIITLSLIGLERKYVESKRFYPIEYCAFLALAFSVAWLFNNFAKGRPKRRSRHSITIDENEPN